MARRGAREHPRVDGRLRPTIHDSRRALARPAGRRRRRARTAGATFGATRTRLSTRSAPCLPWRSRSWPDRAGPRRTSPASSRWWPESSGLDGRRSSSTSRPGPSRWSSGRTEAEDAGRPLAAWLDAQAPRSAARRAAAPAAPIRVVRARRDRAPGRPDGDPAGDATFYVVPVSGSGGVHLGVELTRGAPDSGGHRPAAPLHVPTHPRRAGGGIRPCCRRAPACRAAVPGRRARRVHVDGRARAADAADQHRWLP